MTTLTVTDRAAEPAILAAVHARPGITLPEIAAALGIPAFRVQRVLTVAKRRQLIGSIRAAGKSTWWPAGMVEAAKVAARQAVEDAKREHRRAYAAARFQRRMGELRASPDVADEPIRRHVHPSAPLPFVCRAPASVFHLGAML